MITLLERGEKPIPGKKYLLREHFDFCQDGVCQVQSEYLTEEEKRYMTDTGGLYLVGVAQRADAENGNGRIYPLQTLQREVENYKQIIKENRAYGECDHPDETVIALQNASHRVTDIWWKGNEVWVKLKIHTSTDPGRNIAGHIKDGGAIGLSSRGLGSVNESKNGKLMVEDDFQLICFDIVTEPSTGGAFMHLMEAKQPLVESYQRSEIFSKSYKINRALNEILGV